MARNWRGGIAAALCVAGAALGVYALAGDAPRLRALPGADPAPPASLAFLRPVPPVQGEDPAHPAPTVATAVEPPTTGLLPEPRPYRTPPAPASAAEGIPVPEQVYTQVGAGMACVTRVHGAEEFQSVGCLLDDAGHVLTAAAQLGNASTIWVTFRGLHAQPAAVLFEDHAVGMAVLQVRAPADRDPVRLSRASEPPPDTPLVAVVCPPAAGLVTVAESGSPDAPFLLDGTLALGALLCSAEGVVAGIVVPGDEPGAGSWRAVSAQRIRQRLAAARPEQPAFQLTAADYVRFGVAQADPALARTAFQTALQLEPGWPLAMYNLAVATAQLPDGAATAVAAYRQTTRLDPNFLDAYVNWALLDLSRNGPERAAAVLDNLTVLAPDDPDTWSALGEVYRRMGQPDQAEAALQRALDVAPTHPPTHYNLGVLYASLFHDEARARAAFRRYAQLAPASPHTAAVIAYANTSR